MKAEARVLEVQSPVWQPTAAIRRYEPSDLEAVLRFRAEMYGPSALLSQPEYVRWMFERSAALFQHAPSLWLSHSNGQVVSQHGGILSTMRVGPQTLPLLWATEIVVNPAFQQRGIGSAMLKVVANEAPLVAAFEISDAAKHTFTKAGWLDLGTVPLFVRPINATATLAARGQATWLPLARGVTGALKGWEWAGRQLNQRLAIALEEVSAFDDRADAVWAQAAEHYPVIARRDKAFLNWRYAEFPREHYYRLFYLRRGPQTLGWVVLKTADNRGLSSGVVVDFLCVPKWSYALVSSVVSHFQAEGCEAIYCVHQGAGTRAALQAAGFLKRDTGWSLMANVSAVSPQAARILSEPANWYITSGDSNVDRPREGTVYAS